MKKTFVTAAVVGVLVAVAACGGSSPSSGGSSPSSGGSSPSSGGSSPSSGGSSPSSGGSHVATSTDRDKFVGTWTGNYSCAAIAAIAPIADKMMIKAGSGDLGLSIIIHVDFLNPDTVTGTLTSATEVNVPEQSMGGANGTAKLMLNGDKLDFHGTGLGITCGGSDYTRAP